MGEYAYDADSAVDAPILYACRLSLTPSWQWWHGADTRDGRHGSALTDHCWKNGVGDAVVGADKVHAMGSRKTLRWILRPTPGTPALLAR
jgi:hypothetical protein